jgi:hypothetical protein
MPGRPSPIGKSDGCLFLSAWPNEHHVVDCVFDLFEIDDWDGIGLPPCASRAIFLDCGTTRSG